MPRLLLPSILLAISLVAGAASPASAQGGTPLGSTTLVGKPDSLFSAFLTFLKTHGDSAVSTDTKRRSIVARVKDSDELVIYAFVVHGDSTTVEAQGAKGGMAALIFGLGVVNDWLRGKATRADSAH